MAKEPRMIKNRFLIACEVYDTNDLRDFIGGMTLIILIVTILFLSPVIFD